MATDLKKIGWSRRNNTGAVYREGVLLLSTLQILVGLINYNDLLI